MLLQAELPSPENITDTLTALKWIVGVLMAALVGLIFFARGVLNKQEKQYEDRIADLKNALEEKEDEVKELNAKVIDNIVPTINTLNTTLGKLIEKSR